MRVFPGAASVIFIALAFSMAGCESGDDPAARQLASNAISKLELGTGWDRIEVTTAKRNEYVLKLIYHESSPSDALVAQQDTRKIALAVLSELVARGRRPASEGTFLWIWARRPAGMGESGAELVKVYGHMEYNRDNDQLEFKPWKP